MFEVIYENGSYKQFADIKSVTEPEKVMSICCWNRHLDSLDGVEKFVSLKHIEFENCPRLMSLSGLENCENLRSIKIKSCYDLFDLSALEKCKDLTYVKIENCPSLISEEKMAISYNTEYPGSFTINYYSNDKTAFLDFVSRKKQIKVVE